MAKSSFQRPQGPPKATAATAPQPTVATPQPAAPPRPSAPKKLPAPAPTPAPQPAAPVAPETTELPVVEVHTEIVSDPELVYASQAANIMTAPVGTVIGQIDSTDYPMPWLKLTQTNSPLAVKGFFSAGDITLNDEAILWQLDCKPVELTVLNIQKKFVQKTEYGEELGKVYDTAEAARADGLVAFGGLDVGYVPFAIALVAIKQPEGVDCSIFTREFNGARYGIAFWRITGMAYRSIAGKIYTEANQGNRLGAGLHTGSFLLSAYLEQGQKAPYWAPILNDGEMHDPAFVAWIVEQKGITE